VTATGLLLEDFATAPRIDSRARTVTAADVADFAALTGDHNPLHTDDEAARAAGFPGVVVHGFLGLALAVGLIEETGVHDGTTLAMLEVQHWTFRRPVLAGRQVHARMTVTGLYPSIRDRRRGVLVRHLALLGEDDEVLQEGSITLLVRTRAAESSGSAVS
jgi:acyl dehydratase